MLVDSTCRNMRRLAMAVASQKAVLLEGPIGCGKTALVEFMASVTGHTNATEILKVQLGDQTDSKVRQTVPQNHTSMILHICSHSKSNNNLVADVTRDVSVHRHPREVYLAAWYLDTSCVQRPLDPAGRH